MASSIRSPSVEQVQLLSVKCPVFFATFFASVMVNETRELINSNTSSKRQSDDNDIDFDCDHMFETTVNYFTAQNHMAKAHKITPREALGSYASIIFGLLYAVVTGLVLLLNGLVIKRLWNSKKMRSLRIYLLSLSCADILLIISSGPLTFVEFLSDTWPLGKPQFTCPLVRSLQVLSSCTVTLTIVLISLER